MSSLLPIVPSSYLGWLQLAMCGGMSQLCCSAAPTSGGTTATPSDSAALLFQLFDSFGHDVALELVSLRCSCGTCQPTGAPPTDPTSLNSWVTALLMGYGGELCCYSNPDLFETMYTVYSALGTDQAITIMSVACTPCSVQPPTPPATPPGQPPQPTPPTNTCAPAAYGGTSGQSSSSGSSSSSSGSSSGSGSAGGGTAGPVLPPVRVVVGSGAGSSVGGASPPSTSPSPGSPSNSAASAGDQSSSSSKAPAPAVRPFATRVATKMQSMRQPVQTKQASQAGSHSAARALEKARMATLPKTMSQPQRTNVPGTVEGDN